MARQRRSERLRPVARIADSREQVAAVELAHAQRLVAEREKQLANLVEFRRDYSERLQRDGASGVASARLKDYQLFVTRLDATIEQQRQRLAQAQKALERSRDQWRSLHSRSQALDRAIDHSLRDERRQRDRREQNQSDERSQYRVAED